MADFLTALAYTVGDPPGGGNERWAEPRWPDDLRDHRCGRGDDGLHGANVGISPFPGGTVDEANFWTPLGLDVFTAQGPASAIFDMGVLTGPGGTGQITQTALAQLGWQGTVDGAIGPETLAGVNGVDPNSFVSAFSDAAAAYLQGLADAAANPGWQTRAERLATLQTGIAGAVAQVTTHPTTSAIVAGAIIFGLWAWTAKS